MLLDMIEKLEQAVKDVDQMRQERDVAAAALASAQKVYDQAFEEAQTLRQGVQTELVGLLPVDTGSGRVRTS